jgi:thiol:disulfide interchange protein DsbD
MRILVCAASLAAVLWAAPADPVAWKVKTPPAAVKASGRFSVKLTAEVSEGWHLYSLKPMSEGPIPTRIWLADGQPFKLAGAIQASQPETMQDASFGMEVEQYEGEAEFTLPVQVTGALVGAQKLVISASYQSCNNKLCLPPKTVKVEVPVTVGK